MRVFLRDSSGAVIMNSPSLNDIVNGYSSKRNNNDNVQRPKTRDQIERADRIADTVCRKIGSTGARAFYCKAAYELSEDQIYSCVEIALKGRCPVKYLSWLLSHQLRTNASRS